MIVVFSFSMLTLLAWPSMLIVMLSSLMPRSSEIMRGAADVPRNKRLNVPVMSLPVAQDCRALAERLS